MPVPSLRALPLLACLLAGCSAQILEQVGEISPPRDCAETTKLFNTFSMRAKSTSWKGSKSDTAATLTIQLIFDNDKKWPIALSNSGNGVLYAVEFSLYGEKGARHTPKGASGVTFSSEPKKLKEAPPRAGLFDKQRIASPAQPATSPEKIFDVNFRIRPGEAEEGRLIFEVPRDHYLLAIERKFASKPVSGGAPADHFSVCKISANEFSAMKSASPRGVSGVY